MAFEPQVPPRRLNLRVPLRARETVRRFTHGTLCVHAGVPGQLATVLEELNFQITEAEGWLKQQLETGIPVRACPLVDSDVFFCGQGF